MKRHASSANSVALRSAGMVQGWILNPRTVRPTGVYFSSVKRHSLFQFVALSVLIHLFFATLMAVRDFEESARSRRLGGSLLQVGLRPATAGQPPRFDQKTSNHHFQEAMARKFPEHANNKLKFSPNFGLTVASQKIVAASNERSTTQEGELGGEAISAEVIVAYRLALARNARQYKGMPSEFRHSGLQGVVMLAVEKTVSALEPSVRIERSSGFEELDRLAVGMLGAALMKASIPESLAGRTFKFSIPVAFDFAEQATVSEIAKLRGN